ncbi:MAG: VOC family protein, partial [Mycobacterium sp.]|nr:VOC family protein [Mycobacterium sp.]
ASVAFYDALFGWLGYSSFSSLNMEYQSIYYMTQHVNLHSYIGIQPARTGGKLDHTDQAVGINHIALWARSSKEVDRFHREFLIARGISVTDEPKEYPQYWPGYYAVFFDDPINGIHWELARTPRIPTPRQVWSFYRALHGFAGSRPDLANTVPGLAWQARRALPHR